MAQIARRCIPFTPFDGDLARAKVALVTAGGVHRRDQAPFNIADELGDMTFRIVDGDTPTSELMVTHHHYDHRDADRDVNVVFPLDVLRDLAAEGAIGGVAAVHIGYLGYTMQLRRMYEETAPAIADEIDKRSLADVVLLTGG
jgi:D-proline reductase (dithiol) PrdB